jgi:uncharacterized membrane protein
MTSLLERLAGRALGRVVRAALALVLVAPFLPPFFSSVPGLGAIARLFDAWFAFQCHREAARSLRVFGHVLPVCLRCFGIYLGLGLGGVVARPKLDVWPLRIWVLAAAALMIADVTTESLGLRPEWGLLRLLTGVLLAYPVGSALVWSARGEPAPSDRGEAGAGPT